MRKLSAWRNAALITATMASASWTSATRICKIGLREWGSCLRTRRRMLQWYRTLPAKLSYETAEPATCESLRTARGRLHEAPAFDLVSYAHHVRRRATDCFFTRASYCPSRRHAH